MIAAPRQRLSRKPLLPKDSEGGDVCKAAPPRPGAGRGGKRFLGGMYMDLQAFWAAHPRAAVAFSGGADSAYLLWSAADAGADVRAYFVRTEFQPRFELDDARRLAEQLDVPLTVLEQ